MTPAGRKKSDSMISMTYTMIVSRAKQFRYYVTPYIDARALGQGGINLSALSLLAKETPHGQT